MGIWDNADWQSQSPEIDAEHKKLHQMVASLAAVVRNDQGTGLDTEAVDILIERMRLHFNWEEANARKLDSEISTILHEDHIHLLERLEQVRASMAGDDRPGAGRHLQTFLTELNKHDLEVDIPLFRMLAKVRDPLIG